MSQITPDIEHYSPEELNEFEDLFNFGAWVLEHGGVVLTEINPVDGTEIRRIPLH